MFLQTLILKEMRPAYFVNAHIPRHLQGRFFCVLAVSLLIAKGLGPELLRFRARQTPWRAGPASWNMDSRGDRDREGRGKGKLGIRSQKPGMWALGRGEACPPRRAGPPWRAGRDVHMPCYLNGEQKSSRNCAALAEKRGVFERWRQSCPPSLLSRGIPVLQNNLKICWRRC